jgi:hypothetical protein
MTRRVVHVVMPMGNGEFSACGVAGDAFATGDLETDDVFIDARPGLRVTCPECCRELRNWRGAAKG